MRVTEKKNEKVSSADRRLFDFQGSYVVGEYLIPYDAILWPDGWKVLLV